MATVKFLASVAALLTGPAATIVLIVVGLPGTLGDAMTWVLDWLPTAGRFVIDHAGWLAPAWVLSLVGALLLGWLHLPDIRKRRASRRQQIAIPDRQQLTAAEQQALELLRQFMLTDMSCLLSDMEKLNRASLARLRADDPSTETLVRLARAAIVDHEQHNYYRFFKLFAYDIRNPNLQDLQNALCNYLIDYLKLVRLSHELIASHSSEIRASEPYERWKKGDTDALLRLRKIAEHPLLSDLAIFLHRREFRMGKEHYQTRLLDTELDAARAHRPEALN